MKLLKKYWRWYGLTSIAGTFSLVSACTLLPHSFTDLNDGFEAVSTPIKVKRPNWVFRDKSYNVALGRYKVANTNIEKFKRSGRGRSVSRRKERIGFIEHLVFEGRLAAEKVKYETVAYTSKAEYSFDIPFDSDNVFQTTCKKSKIVHVEEERGRTTFGEKEKRSPQGVLSEQLQKSTLRCNLKAETGMSTLEVATTRDMKPVVSLSSEYASYQVLPIFITIQPGTFHIAIVQDEPETETQVAPGGLYGYAFRNERGKIASVSFANSDGYIIRIKNGLEESEMRFLLGVSHTLLLNEWLYR